MSKINEITLEKYLLKELPGDMAMLVENELLRDSALKERVDNIRKSNVDFLNNHPSSEFVKSFNNYTKTTVVKDSSVKSFSKKKILRIMIPIFSVVCFLAFFLFSPLFRNSIEQTTFKGNESSIYIFKKSGKDVKQLFNNDKVLPGETIQVSYRAEKAAFGVIFSVDGNGTVTVHYPYSGNESANLVMNEKTSLKSSFILDTAPKYEKFYFVTSYQKFDISGLYSGNSEELSVILDVYSKNSEYQIDEFLLNKE